MSFADLTDLFEPHVQKIFSPTLQSNSGIGVVAGVPEEPGKNIKMGDTVKYKQRGPAAEVTRGVGDNDPPTVAAAPDMDVQEVKIDKQKYFGHTWRNQTSGIEYLSNEAGQMDVMDKTRSAVAQLALWMNQDVLEGILPDIGMAIGIPSEELFQNTATPTGAPWEGWTGYFHAGNLLTARGASPTGRHMMLSDNQVLLAAGLPSFGNFDAGGPGAAAVRQGGIPDIRQITTHTQPFGLQSTTVATPSNFGYATEAAAATATIFATPAVYDTEIQIEAAVGAPLDLKEGNVLYFTPSSAQLGNAQRGRIQGYVVAADTAIAGGANGAVPITRGVRVNPANPTEADVYAGLYLRGITSHSAGLCMTEGAVELLMFPPWALGTYPHNIQSGAGNTVGTATIRDKSVAEGGTGLTFWIRMIQMIESFNISVGCYYGYHVVRPAHILRVVTPPEV